MYVDLITQQKKMKLPITSPEYALVGAAPCVPNLYHDMKDILKIKTIKVYPSVKKLSVKG